ncbi:MAG TPA: hypothetical protein VGI73_06145 [Solirubrobacterales bacterium]
MTAVLAALLAAGLLAGCGSSSHSTDSSAAMDGMSMPAEEESNDGHAAHAGDAMPGMQMQGMAAPAAGADGTSDSADGLELTLATPKLTAGEPADWTLEVLDSNGMPVTRFERDQTKFMHLIVVRDDLSGYQHLHPVLDSKGEFKLPVTLPSPGRYRAIGDFTTGGKRYPLGVDVSVPGKAEPVPLPPPSNEAAVDGYTVTLADGMLMAGTEEQLTFTVEHGGQPEQELQTYLGAYGHLVALRKPDLAYSHIHPVAHDAEAGTLTFEAEFPSAGTFRLFLQFRAGGEVHTVAFTVEVMK